MIFPPLFLLRHQKPDNKDADLWCNQPVRTETASTALTVAGTRGHSLPGCFIQRNKGKFFPMTRPHTGANTSSTSVYSTCNKHVSRSSILMESLGSSWCCQIWKPWEMVCVTAGTEALTDSNPRLPEHKLQFMCQYKHLTVWDNLRLIFDCSIEGSLVFLRGRKTPQIFYCTVCRYLNVCIIWIYIYIYSFCSKPAVCLACGFYHFFIVCVLFSFCLWCRMILENSVFILPGLSAVRIL